MTFFEKCFLLIKQSAQNSLLSFWKLRFSHDFLLGHFRIFGAEHSDHQCTLDIAAMFISWNHQEPSLLGTGTFQCDPHGHSCSSLVPTFRSSEPPHRWYWHLSSLSVSTTREAEEIWSQLPRLRKTSNTLKTPLFSESTCNTASLTQNISPALAVSLILSSIILKHKGLLLHLSLPFPSRGEWEEMAT